MTVKDWGKITGAEFLAMNEVEQARVLTHIYRELFFNSVKDYGCEFINVAEDYGINNYATGSSRIEIAFGMLNAAVGMLHQAFTNQNRVELQCLSKETEFAAAVSTELYDCINQMQQDMQTVVELQTWYHAALSHRREGKRHLVDGEGTTEPFTEQEIERDRQAQEQQQQQWKEELEKERQELEDAYWGKRTPPELPEGYSSGQLLIPIWSTGFMSTEELTEGN